MIKELSDPEQERKAKAWSAFRHCGRPLDKGSHEDQVRDQTLRQKGQASNS